MQVVVEVYVMYSTWNSTLGSAVQVDCIFALMSMQMCFKTLSKQLKHFVVQGECITFKSNRSSGHLTLVLWCHLSISFFCQGFCVSLLLQVAVKVFMGHYGVHALFWLWSYLISIWSIHLFVLCINEKNPTET